MRGCQMLGRRGARKPGCQDTKVPECQGCRDARVPDGQEARTTAWRDPGMPGMPGCQDARRL
eukprot:7378940-Pyramimonas_sp.AAC.1